MAIGNLTKREVTVEDRREPNQGEIVQGFAGDIDTRLIAGKIKLVPHTPAQTVKRPPAFKAYVYTGRGGGRRPWKDVGAAWYSNANQPGKVPGGKYLGVQFRDEISGEAFWVNAFPADDECKEWDIVPRIAARGTPNQPADDNPAPAETDEIPY